MTARTTLLGCALAASLFGCGPPSECSLVVDTVAPRLAHIKEIQPSSLAPSSVADLRATSDAYNDLAAVTERLTITENRVKDLANRYHENAVNLAIGYKLLADALASEDAGELRSAKVAMDRGASNELQLRKKLEEICVLH